MRDDRQRQREAARRWKARYKNASTPADKFAAAVDWYRAQARLAGELGATEMCDLYLESGAEAIAKWSVELADQLETFI